jgi:hypothetical protein
VVEPRVITIGHKLGKEEALRRVEPALSKASEGFPVLKVLCPDSSRTSNALFRSERRLVALLTVCSSRRVCFGQIATMVLKHRSLGGVTAQ